jgi:hypothetical protein
VSAAPAKRVVALFRKAAYSPNQHRTNDTAILEETIGRLEARGWSANRFTEGDVEASIALPEADLYLNMCQGPRASHALRMLEANGACILNLPSSVLGCHRHQLVPAMIQSGLPFPDTDIIDCQREERSDHGSLRLSPDDIYAHPIVKAAARAGEKIWIKRGDVHAERSEDVVAVLAGDVAFAVDAFRSRGIRRISLQRHVAGPVVKFYAIADRRFFRFYDAATGPEGPKPKVDIDRLQEIAFAAAAAVGLSIFGGDVVLESPNDPVLIDLNDWPSFAPFRDDAAEHIAEFAAARAQRQHYSSTTTGSAFANDLIRRVHQ